MRMYRKIFVILLGVFSTIQISNSKGTLELQFIKYTNPDGSGSNGNCCDGISFFCGSACDHNFDICVDVQSGPRDMKVCPYGYKSSGEISNQDTIQFGNKVGVLDNPVKFQFSKSWPGGVKVKINVHDKDDNNDDHVDYLAKDYTAKPKLYSNANSGWVEFDIKGRTTLDAKIRVYCDMYYYDSNCDTYCKPGNSISEGFYTCDPNTGSMICKDGWQGKYCKTPTDPCIAKPCESYQICNSTGTGKYECVCPADRTGQFCNETATAECTDTTCLNGGNCSDTNGTISCVCQSGWTGAKCESEYGPCDTHMCYNNGTCNSTDDGKVTCICEDGWTGENCETEYDPCDMCMNNSTCSSENGSQNITCSCLDGWSGNYCETKLDLANCDAVPCMNNGTCINNGTTYECSCAEGFSGMNCEIKDNVTSPEVTTKLATTTSQTTTPTTAPKTPPVELTFVGVLKDDDALRREFHNLIYDLTETKDGIKILYRKEYPTTAKGEPLTKVLFRVYKDGKDINAELNTLLSETRHEDLDKYFTLKLYQDEPIKPQKLEHTGWIHTYWYVILILILVFIILLVLVGCIVARVKRRKVSKRNQKEFLARQSSNVSDALPAQSFENTLYFEMNQPMKKEQQASTSGK